MWIAILALVIVFIFISIIILAPEGYEDEEGFHLGSLEEQIYREELQRGLMRNKKGTAVNSAE
jgi:uncharacterized membrane protein